MERSRSVSWRKTFLLVVLVSEKGWGGTWEVYVTGWWSDVLASVRMVAEVGVKNSEAAGEIKIWSRRLLLALYGVGYREKDRAAG